MSRTPCLVAAVVAALLTLSACGADRPIDVPPAGDVRAPSEEGHSTGDPDGSSSESPVVDSGEDATPLDTGDPLVVPDAMHDPDPAGIVPVAEYFALLLFDAQARLEVRPLDKVAAGTCSFCLFILDEIARQGEEGVTLSGVDGEITGPGVVVECVNEFAEILGLLCVDFPYRFPEIWETSPDGSVTLHSERVDAFLYVALGSLHHQPGSDSWIIYDAIPHADDITA